MTTERTGRDDGGNGEGKPDGPYAAGVEAALAIVRETKDGFDPAKNPLAIPGSDQERALFTSLWSTAFGLECDIKKLLPGPAIRCLAPPPVAPGWQVVPKEPTEEMLDAAEAGSITLETLTSVVHGSLPYWRAMAKYHWTKMLASAPASPADTGGKEEREATAIADPDFSKALDEWIEAFCDDPGASYEDVAEALEAKAAALRRAVERNR